MEMFNVHYITKLDEKFVAIMQTMSTLDANIKQLQERSQTWDLFTHHMNSWNEHIKSMDHKFDILKKNLDSLPLIENQLHNTDFKIQHIFDKTDLINEKFHEFTKTLLNKVASKPNKQQGVKENKATTTTGNTRGVSRNWSQEDFEQTEILLRLSKIQRLLQNTCSAIRLDREYENNGGIGSSGKDDETLSDDIKLMISQININLEKLPIKEIKQSLNLNKKHEKALESLTTTISHIDERTVRIFDTNSYQYKKMLSSYKNTESEVLTFTNNANILLKKVENIIKATVDYNSQLASQIYKNDKCNSTIMHTTPHWNDTSTIDDVSDEVEDDIIDQKGKCCIIFPIPLSFQQQ